MYLDCIKPLFVGMIKVHCYHTRTNIAEILHGLEKQNKLQCHKRSLKSKSVAIWPLKYLNWCGWEKSAKWQNTGRRGVVFSCHTIRQLDFSLAVYLSFVSLA